MHSTETPIPTFSRNNRPFGLTSRELEIAALVTEDLSNRKIAATLSVSVRTVETHLSNIFAKLGTASRVGVAVKLAHDAKLHEFTSCRRCGERL